MTALQEAWKRVWAARANYGDGSEFESAMFAVVQAATNEGIVSNASLKWQPIETAPRDGTQILAWITGIEPRPRIVYWADRGFEYGWFGLQTQHFLGVNVTHWMPLPEPPQ